MKVVKLATTGALTLVLLGLTAVPQLVAIGPVYAQESAAATLQASDLPIVEGAADKEEVVYANLSATGEVRDLYVVNNLFFSSSAMVRDYGTYDEVLNLTDESALGLEADNVLVVMDQDSFTYQGNLITTDLPWKIDIAYTLDGVETSPEQLAGASGALKITVATEQNTAVDPLYFDNYLLQITCTIPLDRAHGIEAPDGSVALAGADTTVSFMVMPGKTGTYELTAQVQDFEMEGMSIAAIPFSMAFDLPDTESLVAQFNELIAGADRINAGSVQLQQGASEMNVGASALDQGASKLESGSSSLSDGVASYADGVSQLKDGLSQAAQLSSVFAPQFESLVKSSDGIIAANEAAKQQIEAIEDAIEGNAALSEEDKDQLRSQLAGLSASLNTTNEYAGGVKALADNYPKLDLALGQLYVGAEALDEQGAMLKGGANELEAGTKQFADSTGSLKTGTEKLADGSKQLADGTSRLAQETRLIPEKVRGEIDQLMSDFDKSDFEPRSFVDARNTNVDLVQFVMLTDAIHAPEAEEPEPEPEDESLLSRFFALFS